MTDTDRRAFLGAAGKFALIVPPTMTYLLSTTMSSGAIAQSNCNNGGGNGDEGCDNGGGGGADKPEN
jgi:hypothetical protein